jgi:threonine dehydrogenase-like Zn-dependent dehydrogenase
MDEIQSLFDTFLKHPDQHPLSMIVPQAGKHPVLSTASLQPTGDHEIRVMMVTMGYCGRDKSIVTGQKTAVPGRIGHEGAGIVLEKGRGVDTIEVGQKVFIFPFINHHNIGYDWPSGGMGIFSNFPVIPAEAIHPITQSEVTGRDWLAFSLVEPFAGVLRGLRRAEIERKTALVILGAGPIGCAQAIVAKYINPAIRVVLVDVSLEKLKCVQARKIPADEFILSTHTDELRPRLKQMAGPLIIHSNPLKNSLKQALDLAPDQGTVLLFSGIYDWTDADNHDLGPNIAIDPHAIHYEEYDVKHPLTIPIKHKTVTLIGSRGFAKDDFYSSADLIENKKIDPLPIVTKILKFDKTILDTLSREGSQNTNIKILMSPYDAIVRRKSPF